MNRQLREVGNVGPKKQWHVKRLAVLGATLAAVLVATVVYLLRDPLPRFMARRSTLASVREQPPIVDGRSELRSARLVAASGLTVDVTIRRQVSDSGQRLPLVIILGGHLTGADAARIVGETPGMVVAAMSYPFQGDPRPSAAKFLREIPKIRAAFLDTPPALMLTLDYLLGRPEVDANHVEAVGVSLGAPFVTIAGALDSRIDRVWALHGSGGSYVPLEANMRRTIASAPLRAIGASIANVIIAGPRLAPEQWVSRISPRPFVMVNAENDERLPRSAVDALFLAASHPKEQVWMSGAHVHGDAPTIRRLVEIVVTRVREGVPGGP
jgi:dienelactone hydrolase